MAKILRLVGLMVVAVGVAHATPVIVTSPGGLSANDSVNWSQLGGDGAIINAAFAATSAGGRPIAGGLGGAGQVAVVGTSWTAGPGFNIGNSLIWTLDQNNAGSGPLSLSFPTVFGAGLWIQSDAPGRFTAQVQVYNGGVLLSTFSEVSDAVGDGIFLGALDTISDITRVVFSLTSCTGACDLRDFAVNSLLLNASQVHGAPEPTSLSLLLLGAAGLGLFRRSRRANAAVAKEEKTV